MKDSEKGKFEDAWKNVFSNAEQAPSEEVWAGVEQDLNKAETVMMKRRVVFYQRLAAASILFALLLGGFSTYYILNLEDQTQMAQLQRNADNINRYKVFDNNRVTPLNETPASQRFDDDHISSNESVIVDQRTLNQSNSPKGIYAPTSNPSMSYEKDHPQFVDNKRQEHQSDFALTGDYPSLLSMIPEPSVGLKGELRNVTIVRILPAMPSLFMNSKKDNPVKENLWASLGASTGNYTPPSGFTSASSALNSNQIPSGLNSGAQSAYSTTSSKGTVYAVGMNVGKRISKRWLLQGGVSYMNQAVGYTSNYAVVDASNTVLASVADYSNFKSFSSIIPVASPYEINSVNEYIAVPLQAGYMLVDKRIALQLNSGVSTNFFMQNTLTDKSGQLSTYSSGGGETSPYRSVSWAGLLGTELSYRLGTQYRISMVPGLRYSLNSVLKSDASPSNPMAWDVGFRFRYIFK
jgi:hypothetical protein